MTRLISVLLLSMPLLSCSVSENWSTASRESAGLAPDPGNHPGAVVQVYAADAWGWRGWFAVHTWITAKRSAEDMFTVYDVVGWRQRWGSPVMAAYQDVPDRHWFGSKPQLIVDLRGEQVDALIDRIEKAVDDYPWKNEYQVFPGPNSNTFVAWVGSKVPELNLRLPFSAIGSGYIARRNTELGRPIDR